MYTNSILIFFISWEYIRGYNTKISIFLYSLKYPFWTIISPVNAGYSISCNTPSHMKSYQLHCISHSFKKKTLQSFGENKCLLILRFNILNHKVLLKILTERMIFDRNVLWIWSHPLTCFHKYGVGIVLIKSRTWHKPQVITIYSQVVNHFSDNTSQEK